MATKTDPAERARAANLLGALALEVAERGARQARAHPNATTSSLAALNLIGAYAGCSNSALARALGLSHTATVRLVDKLEAAGLVTSGTGADRRAVALHLTPEGVERVRAAITARRRDVDDLLAILPADDVAHLARIAGVLLAAMVESGDDADHLCRLCDENSCPDARCPVHSRAVALERGP